MRWLRRTNGKEFAPLVIEVDSAEQANRLITEGVIIGYDLKMTERYDASCRITQCFKCQKYGHISSICSNTEKCGHCGGGHNTETCAGVSPAPRRRCAACNGGDHASWSTGCPARARETLRAKTARQALPKLFPISTIVPTLRETFGAAPAPTPAESMRLAGNSQATEGWTTVTAKKRKLQPLGRPIGSANKAKVINESASQSTFNFTGQLQRSAQRADNTHKTPAATQPVENSQTGEA
jgi:hypothetical protein